MGRMFISLFIKWSLRTSGIKWKDNENTNFIDKLSGGNTPGSYPIATLYEGEFEPSDTELITLL